jgi:hypothetical protein
VEHAEAAKAGKQQGTGKAICKARSKPAPASSEATCTDKLKSAPQAASPDSLSKQKAGEHQGDREHKSTGTTRGASASRKRASKDIRSQDDACGIDESWPSNSQAAQRQAKGGGERGDARRVHSHASEPTPNQGRDPGEQCSRRAASSGRSQPDKRQARAAGVHLDIVEARSGDEADEFPGSSHERDSGNLLDPKDVFKASHRAISKNWNLPSNFPSQDVVAAYMSPRVDTSKDKFEFRKPDLGLLRQYCKQRFGWQEVCPYTFLW